MCCGGGGSWFSSFSLRFLMQLEFLMIKISNAQTTSFNLKRKKRKKLLVQNAVTLKTVQDHQKLVCYLKA